ncbi:MAG: hypothetical protein DYG98_17650 [Haliscomenobacteraceae bacterium CHB4]|nr:hypothetical protein [Saprospiraceae bacterium]MCE7924879.1 hypothetical protein [Haliscomenobacteraceae bacterium CHB4]
MKHLFTLTFFIAFGFGLNAQNTARITGNLQTNGNFFIRDSAIGAANLPQYDNQKFGAESWLALNYSNWGFDIGVRFDLFNNSNLLNPTGSFTDEGIGRWYVHKKIDKFDLSGGYLYDQIGSGIIFRAYEERTLMIDNALKGVKVGYEFNDNWKVKAFTGRQKRQFDTYGSVVRGGAVEGFIKPDSAKNFTLAPGAGVVARTYDKETVDRVVSEMSSYLYETDRTGVQYNTYAMTLYNTLTLGDFSWYVEGAYKTKDAIFNEFREHAALVGSDTIIIPGTLVNTDGYIAYTSIAYATKGLGITLEGKYTENFRFRTDPNQIGVQGQINFLPPIARQNTFRLPARFAPNTQELGEQGLQLDVRYALNKKISLGLNVSDIYNLDGQELYREIAPEFTFKKDRKWQALLGLQFLKYNIGVYQLKPDPEDTDDTLPWIKKGQENYVDAFTPYAEYLYKFTPRKSLRVEAQYLWTDDEFGSWVNALVEFGWAPHWLIYASDMYKISHDNADPEKTKYDGLHYPSVGVVYTHKANRFSLAFVKQVEGINCAGGICRLEPTFSGVRLNVSSSF